MSQSRPAEEPEEIDDAQIVELLTDDPPATPPSKIDGWLAQLLYGYSPPPGTGSSPPLPTNYPGRSPTQARPKGPSGPGRSK